MEGIKNLFYGKKASKLAFEELNAADTILIETQNNTYRFLILDLISGRGILSGGAVGKSSYAAMLIGSLIQEGSSFRLDSSCLKTGARANFYLENEDGADRLVTSIITGLFLVRDDKAQRRIA